MTAVRALHAHLSGQDPYHRFFGPGASPGTGVFAALGLPVRTGAARPDGAEGDARCGC
ncbi:hypothetical protein AB0M80_37740 [Amycolatopsis sp. NPDC051045]|uniref:hypothetical protein n=1 Tax=Amycolatopsis sp. NPDC051045 TaxID=3156922 RepID=UPI003422CD2D